MPKKIAILGGGASSLVTAYELSNLPDFAEKYELTVYQIGWRLGGKGASGRNAKDHQRIEEHGLHIMFGFYDNALGAMRGLYEAMGRAPTQPLATFEDAFKPHDFICMMENYQGQWLPWKLDPIPNPLSPGEDGFLKPWDYVKRMIEWGLEVIHNDILHSDATMLGECRATIQGCRDELVTETVRLMQLSETIAGPMPVANTLGTLTKILEQQNASFTSFYGPLGAGQALSSATWLPLELANSLVGSTTDSGTVLYLITKAVEALWEHEFADNTALRRLRMMLDLFFATARGLIASGIIFPPHDWFSIDNYDLTDWLRKYGANETTLNSPLIWAMKDAAYHTYAPIAAGSILQSMLRMIFTYRGNILYKMQAGMGDVIFTPLYEVLKKRGVRFEFFQAVRNLELSDDKERVSKITMGRQATLKSPSYEPLVDVKGLACWPSEALYDQLVQGEALKAQNVDLENYWTKWPDVETYTLNEGTDFDQIVLGISVAGLPVVAQELLAHNPRLAQMCQSVKTAQTMGVQVWLKPTLQELGWELTPPVMIPYVEPLDTWADMTHLLPLEDWPAGTVGNLAYLTSAMEDKEPIAPQGDTEYPWRQTQRVKEYTISFLEKDAQPIWPKSVNAEGQFDWNLVVAPPTVTGVARANYQYYRAPLSPSERYVLAVPGSSAKRLRAEESGFDNVVLTGDWTKTALSIGCLEAATMAGIMSARVIDPRVPKAKNDWLPDPKPVPPTPPGPSATYIQMDGQLLGIPPIELDVELNMFLLPADMGNLRKLVDQQLNLGGETVYRPIGPFVALYASRLNNFPLGNPIGNVPELDYGIWVPLLAGKKVGKLFKPERIVTYTPYIWVDNGVALIGGRTVFGFSKNTGDMTFPADVKQTKRLSLETQVLPTYGPNQQVVTKRLIDVHQKPFSLLDEAKGLWEGAEGLIDAVGDTVEGLLTGHVEVPVPSLGFIKSLLSTMSVGMRMVFLKQFPDITNANKACYQAVTEADVPITGDLKGGFLRGQYAVDIYRYESHQIAKTLGLFPVESNSEKDTFIALEQGWSTFRAVVQNGTVIWRAEV